MKIRRYEKKDWERLCIIHDKARMDELVSSVDPKAFLSLEESFEEEGLFDGEVWVAEEGTLVTGFVSFTPNELAWLYVEPDHYRKGIGRALLQFAIERGDPIMECEVLSGNSPALELYLSEGFKKIKLVKGKLEGNETFIAEGWIMRRGKE